MNDRGEQSDGILAARAAQGDRRAEELLMQRYWGPLVGFFARHWGGLIYSEPEDLALETLIRVHQGLPRRQSEVPFSAWIFRIAWNVGKTRGREDARQHGAELRSQDLLETSLDDYLERVIAPNTDPCGELLADEWRRALDEIISRQPEHYRQILALHYQVGLSYLEIATMLGMSRSAVKSRLDRARDAVKRALADTEWFPKGEPPPNGVRGRGSTGGN